ncbi:hypothetical protein ACA910_014113 [Epithemia clementina (nom. ined.)]
MSTVSASDWIKGISLSILASIIGGASKLAIRKSWLLQEPEEGASDTTLDDDEAQTEEGVYNARHTSNNSSDSSPVYPSSSRSFLRLRSTNSHDDGLGQQQQDRTANCIDNDDGCSRTNGGNDDDDNENDDDEANDNLAQQSCRKKYWLALALRGSGMVGMTFLNPACCVLAMNYASPSILAPFSGLTLVWIVLFSHPLVGEQPSATQVVACSLIVLGEVIVAIFGDHTNDEGISVEDVQKSYGYPPFILYFVGLTIWMASLFYWMQYDDTDDKWEKIKRFSWGVSGGSVTGLQNFLKDSLTILKAVRDDQTNSSLPWYSPIMVALAAGSAFGGLLCLTGCMKRYDATYSSAMFVGSFVVSASIMSAVHYATFDHLDSIWNWIFYPLGLIILMAGVWMLVNEHDEGSDAEQRTAGRRNGPVEMQEPLVMAEPPDQEDDISSALGQRAHGQRAHGQKAHGQRTGK